MFAVKQTKPSMKKEALEKQYRQITGLYDMAEELATTVDSEFDHDPEAQFVLVGPLINQVAESTDVLSEEFLTILENPSRKKSAKSKIEAALRKLFLALEEYRSRLIVAGQKTLVALANIADPVVDKIRKQAEKIILIFMQFIELSLARIMHKNEVEQFERAHGKVGLSAQPSH